MTKKNLITGNMHPKIITKIPIRNSLFIIKSLAILNIENYKIKNKIYLFLLLVELLLILTKQIQ